MSELNWPPPGLEKRNAAPRQRDGANRKANGWLAGSETSVTGLPRQALRIIRNYGLTPATARVTAELAFGEGRS